MAQARMLGMGEGRIIAVVDALHLGWCGVVVWGGGVGEPRSCVAARKGRRVRRGRWI